MNAPIDRTAIRERNEYLWLHHAARQARPSAATMASLSARYPKGVRFRVHQEGVMPVYGGARTMFRPVIEIMIESNGRFLWTPYLWLEHEEVSDEEATN